MNWETILRRIRFLALMALRINTGILVEVDL